MRDTAIVGLAGFAWILLASPLIYPFPEMVDWPGHQVRHVLAARLPGDPVLDAMYTIDWRLIPNLAGDLAMLAIGPVFGLALGSRVLWSLGMAGWIVGPLLLQRALFQKTTAFPLIGSLFVYNALLYMGFENFYLTAPLAMAVLAGWIATEGRGSSLARHLGLALAAFGVWTGHLVVWGVLGLWIVSWEFGHGTVVDRLRRATLAGTMFLPGVGLFVAAQRQSPATHGTGTSWGFGLFEKFGALFSPVLQYDASIDVPLFLGVLPMVALVTLAMGRPRVHPRVTWLLVTMAIATVLMPRRLAGVEFMDQRLPPMLLGLLVASVDVRFAVPRWAGFVAALVSLGIVARVSTTHGRWARHSADVQQLLAAAEVLEPGTRVLPAGPVDMRHWHTSSWLATEARAFVPSLFTGAHLLKVKPAFTALDHPTPSPAVRDVLLDAYTRRGDFGPDGDPGALRYLSHWWTDFDVLLWLRPDHDPPFPDRLEPIAHGRWFTLYRLPSAPEEAP